MDNKQEEPPKQDSKAKKVFEFLFIKKWHPQQTADHTILLFGFCGIVSLIFGIVMSVLNNSVTEVDIKNYQDSCIKIDGDYCVQKFQVSENMESPIYMFYSLDNFYQNHRTYMKSKSATQMEGTIISQSAADSACDPITRNQDLDLPFTMVNDEKLYHNYEDQPVLKGDDVANPCGIIAKSIFNDQYELYASYSADLTPGSQFSDQITIIETDIAWSGEDKKYKQPGSDEDKKKQWISTGDEHFIVWMRTAGLPNFKKPWGRIETKLEKGKDYYFRILDKYNVEEFKGSKHIFLSTASGLGGKNPFLGAIFYVIGVICIVIALLFLAKKKATGNQFGQGINKTEGTDKTIKYSNENPN